MKKAILTIALCGVLALGMGVAGRLTLENPAQRKLRVTRRNRRKSTVSLKKRTRKRWLRNSILR